MPAMYMMLQMNLQRIARQKYLIMSGDYVIMPVWEYGAASVNRNIIRQINLADLIILAYAFFYEG